MVAARGRGPDRGGPDRARRGARTARENAIAAAGDRLCRLYPARHHFHVIIGALAGHFYEHLADRNAASPRQAAVIRRLGVILASGLIVGESLVNVVLAGLVAAAKVGS
jgi:uncharacterized oligopeptide transporter (OPT) family protein